MLDRAHRARAKGGRLQLTPTKPTTSRTHATICGSLSLCDAGRLLLFPSQPSGRFRNSPAGVGPLAPWLFSQPFAHRVVRPGAHPLRCFAVLAVALRLGNGLTANLWDHSEARQMKFFIATFSLLVLLALSGSMVALLVGVSGYLPDVGAGTQAASAKSTSRLR